MKPAKPTLALALPVCLVLCGGSVLAAGNGNATGRSVTRADVTQRVVDGRGEGSLAVRKANSMLNHARTLIATGRTNEAVSELNEVVRMDLPANREGDKLIAEAYSTLGDVYRAEAGGPKAVQFYNLALERMSPELDGDAIATTHRLIAEARNAVPACLNPRAMQTSSTPGMFDPDDDTCGASKLLTLPSSEIMSISPSGDHNWRRYTTTAPTIVRIETISPDIFGDDTNLALYGGCTDPTPENFIQFDDDGGPGFLSLIVTACLPAGTYYVDVGGYSDIATPDDFELAITQVSTCVIPTADSYEPDNEIDAAKRIGFRNNGVGEGNQHGRDNKNIQHHSIYAAGDIDFVRFGLGRANWVRMETLGSQNPDTVMALSFSNGTLLAINDDKASNELTSKIEACLPSGDWRGIAIAYSANDTFEYDWAVDVEHPCLFENEPNGALATANSIVAGETMNGIHTFSPVGDNDFFKFTLTEAALVVLETSGYDIFDVDTTLDVYNSAGTHIAADEDGGDGFLSRIEVQLQPGTYYVNVWSFFAGYYFPYGLTLSLAEPPLTESEPNDSCGTADPVALGDSVQAAINPAGESDHFMVTLPEAAFVELETTGPSGDTVINITSADGLTFVGCDDDGGDGLFSAWGCCLPAGNYCVAVRAYSPSSTIPNYTIQFRGVGACTPSEPLTCPSTGLSCPP